MAALVVVMALGVSTVPSAQADDLASLALDAELEREGFARSGPHPLLFPG